MAACVTASAATITVTNTSDSGPGSLRQAIADAAPGDTIRFDAGVFSSPNTITLTTGRLNVDKNLTINGPGSTLLSVSGNDGFQVFAIDFGVTATLDGLTIKKGNTVGNPELANYGGGIANFGDLIVSNSTVSGNFAGAGGGGIYSSGTLAVTKSIISGNTAAIYCPAPDPAGCASEGGGIFNDGTLTVSNSTISNNASIGDDLHPDWSVGFGGGIQNNTGALTISDSTISGNASTGTGGGIRSWTSLTVTNSVMSGNIAGSGGAAVYDQLGSMAVSNSIISGNTGDGIVVYGDLGGDGVLLSLNNSTVSANSGAGIITSRISVSLNDTTISGNTGGGISIGSDTVITEALDAANVTVVNNSGNGVSILGSVAGKLTNAIVASNTAGDMEVTGLIGSASHNLIGDASSSGGIPNGVNGNIVGVNPMLGPLQNNGGPTMTHALLRGSPAIGAGDNALAVDANGEPLPYDQRGPGFRRIMNGTVDIGAFERQEPTRRRPTSRGN